MNEQNELSPRDIETLAGVDALLAAPNSTPQGTHQVSALLANTVPQADGSFQAELEARLVAQLESRQSARMREFNNQPRGSAPETVLKRRPLLSGIPFTRTAGRFGSAVVGVVLLAVLALALAFLLQAQRGDIPVIAADGTATTNALATLTASSSNLMPDSLVIIRTSLLPISVIPWSPVGRSSTSAVAWSGDGRTLASAAPDGIISLWNATTGEKLGDIDTSLSGSLRGLEWSPNGRMLATYSHSTSAGTSVFELWDATTGGKLYSFTEQQGRITSLDWSPDSSVIAWTDGWKIRLWDRSTESILPKPQPTWPALITEAGIEPNLTTNLDWSPDGARLATSQSNIVKIWDPKTGQELAALSHNGPVTRIDWSHDGSMIAVLVAGDPTQVGGQSSSLVLWDTTTNRQIDTPVLEGSVTGIAWLPRGLVLALSVVDDNTGTAHVSRYDVITGQLVRITDSTATELAWSPDNQTLAIANSAEGIITLRNGWADTKMAASPTPSGPTSPTASVNPLTPVSYPPDQPGPAPACGLIWSLVASGSKGVLEDVVAISKDDVWAVGHTSVWPLGFAEGEHPPSKTLIQHWDGERWSIVPSPNVEENDNRLYGVSALSSNDVWAVGQYGSWNAFKTLTMHWDGKEWKIVGSPDVSASNELRDVVAISPNDVWAVGEHRGCGDPPCDSQALVLHWDGQGWSVADSSSGGLGSRLSGVSATSANDVWAVGSFPADKEFAAPASLVLHWDGKAWTRSETHHIGSLNSVTAITPNDVWAIGGGWGSETQPDATTLLLHWDGKAWAESLGSKMQLGTGGGLRAITATATDDVWTVGGGPSPLIQHWDGTQWSLVATPTRSDPVMGGLFGVAAVGPGEMWAVGGQDSPAWPVPGEESMIMRYSEVPCPTRTTATVPIPASTKAPAAVPVPTRGCDPHWDIIRLTGEDSAETTNLGELAAITEDDIWAVGSHGWAAPGSTSSENLAMHWDGKEWRTIPTPNKGDGLNSLTGITAVASDDVWAIGSYAERPDAPYEMVLLHWDGTQWSIMPSPSSDRYAIPVDIDAVATDDIWAVGNGAGGLLTMHWNGNEWSTIPAPRVGKVSSYLSAVTAIGTNDAWAVGSYSDIRPTEGAPAPDNAFTMHWDGKAWNIVPVPDNTITELTDITATGPDEVWATGIRLRERANWATAEMTVLRWDGSKWSTVPIPKQEIFNSRPKMVAVSAQDVWAFGPRTLHWDGTRWTRVYEPQINVTDWTGERVEDVALYGAVATKAGTVWSLGALTGSTPLRIIARYNQSPCPNSTP